MALTEPAPEAPPATHPTAPSSPGWPRLAVTLAARTLAHPRLALDLGRVAWRVRRRRWYRRPPFLPLPAREYVRWRMYTAYGDYDAVPPADDVIRYARWIAAGR